MTRTPRATSARDRPDFTAAAADIEAIVAGRHGDPFSVLGQHPAGRGLVARCLVPGADEVAAFTLAGKPAGALTRRHEAGFF